MPSKSRGLRTSTGCLTCRKRRVKCDEGHPRCQNCIRVDRQCMYARKESTPRRTLRTLSRNEERRRADTDSSYETEALVASSDPNGADQADIVQPWIPFAIDHEEALSAEPPIIDGGMLFDDSLMLSLGNVMSPSLGPFEWYDLLAQDAITNIQEHNASNDAHRWNFDKFSLSRRQTPRQSPTPQFRTLHMQNESVELHTTLEPTTEPWNTTTRIALSSEEMIFLHHYITNVGPILDLFDPSKHFSDIVPHLALHNVGLLKSLLAVGACHMALDQPLQRENEYQPNMPPSTPASTHSNYHTVSNSKRIAEQYYYETLHYLAQNLLYPSYTSSHEILATAIMISTYEMLGAYSELDNGNWGRHLKGAFWIQRNQDNDGESIDGLRQAVWWAWLRQDIWAAFREGRPALTIWQPKKPLSDLTTHELATRIVYIAAKCVQFAATTKETDIAGYIEAGETLLKMLEQWKRILPPSFEPVPIAVANSHGTPASSVSESSNQFQPIWIHPPAHAAAIQTYHFARIIVVLNQPSTGGLNNYQARGKTLRESMSTICGLAVAQQSQNLPSAFVSFQAVYTAALCAETQDKKTEVLSILEKTLAVSKFPAKSMLSDLIKLWDTS